MCNLKYKNHSLNLWCQKGYFFQLSNNKNIQTPNTHWVPCLIWFTHDWWHSVWLHLKVWRGSQCRIKRSLGRVKSKQMLTEWHGLGRTAMYNINQLCVTYWFSFALTLPSRAARGTSALYIESCQHTNILWTLWTEMEQLWQNLIVPLTNMYSMVFLVYYNW